MTFYKDGSRTTEPAPVTVPAGQPAAGPCQIVAGLGDATGLVGQVSDLRVWHTAPTGAQIQQAVYAVDGSLYTQLGQLVEQGLLLAAAFDAGRGAPVNHPSDVRQRPAHRQHPVRRVHRGELLLPPLQRVTGSRPARRSRLRTDLRTGSTADPRIPCARAH